MARVPTTTIIYPYGDTFDEPGIQWLDQNGSAHDLTGYTAKMEVRDSAGTVVLTLQDSDGSLTIVAATGTVDFSATAAQMTAGTLVEGQVYAFDLQVTDGTIIRTLVGGKFWVDAEITE